VKAASLIAVFMAFVGTAFAQSDSLEDVFPLALGNRWAYDFNSGTSTSIPHSCRIDTGYVAYEIIGVARSADSTRWQFIQRRIYQETVCNTYQMQIQDSSVFEIVELNQGRHELYTPVYNPYSCFPFQRSYADSARFFRYTHADSAGNAVQAISFQDPNFPGSSYDYKAAFVVHKKTGIVQSTGSQINYVYHNWEGHHLIDYFLSAGENSRLPSQLSLSPNYPNPFNPTTKIQFTIVNRQLTIVKVFDLVGREVATLVNEVKEPGRYTVQFDGSNLASGIYFYRMQAGDYIQTKRLTLLK
jgi:hypothetical protein